MIQFAYQTKSGLSLFSRSTASRAVCCVERSFDFDQSIIY